MRGLQNILRFKAFGCLCYLLVKFKPIKFTQQKLLKMPAISNRLIAPLSPLARLPAYESPMHGLTFIQ
jgi:hypothetical protein